MEVLQNEEFFGFKQSDNLLLIDRFNCRLQFDSDKKVSKFVASSICLGKCYGIIGKLVIEPWLKPSLILITNRTEIGNLRISETNQKHRIFAIKSIAILRLSDAKLWNDLESCEKHGKKTTITGPVSSSSIRRRSSLSKTLISLKNVGSSLKQSTQNAANVAVSQVKSRMKWSNDSSRSKNKELVIKRLFEEIQRILADNESFYYSETFDLTNKLSTNKTINGSEFEVADLNKKFFWNYNLLKDFLDGSISSGSNCQWRKFLTPLIQGCVQIKSIDFANFNRVDCQLWLISRRSRFRCGTRYKKRGVNSNGHCANYVESEQIFVFRNEHKISFLQTRGSIPIFWSQPGYQYRPPPQIDQSEEVTKSAFQKHFDLELANFDSVSVLNLVQQTGKEKILWDHFTNHLCILNNPKVTYITFDFHRHCGKNHFENLSLLIDAIQELLNDMKYFWIDSKGTICKQNGVFRVNCVDCLDRTNIAQTAIAECVLKTQLTKLGLFVPGDSLPSNLKSTFQIMWANNGDILSKQYAGTNALKGDYTRTGERKLTGLMKDGMNSANRYYLSHFKDNYRQAVIDLLQGNQVRYDAINEHSELIVTDEKFLNELERQLNEQKSRLNVRAETFLGCWGLKYASNRSPAGTTEPKVLNAVLIVNEHQCHLIDFDESREKFRDSYRLPIERIRSIHLAVCELVEEGEEAAEVDDRVAGASNDGSSFNETDEDKRDVNCDDYCVIIFYNTVNDIDASEEMLKFSVLRSANLHFFNNGMVTMNSSEEKFESLKAICEALLVVRKFHKLPEVPFQTHTKKLQINLNGKLQLSAFNLHESPLPSSAMMSPSSSSSSFSTHQNMSKELKKLRPITVSNSNQAIGFLPKIGIVMSSLNDSELPTTEIDQTDSIKTSNFDSNMLPIIDMSNATRSNSYSNFIEEPRNIQQSKSDNSVFKTTKGLVLNPLAKFAKNVQNLATNLDVGPSNEDVQDSNQKLAEWSKKCKSRLFAI